MNYLTIISTCYCGDGAVKLEKARQLLEIYGKGLLQQEEILDQLRSVREKVGLLNAHMTAMNMGKTCTRCAATPKGGCCSVYMGNENNDALLLLMNILAGVDVRPVCDNGVECCFLGIGGCILLFKPIFCLNYLCKRIQKESNSEELMKLELKTGILLTAQSDLEQLLIRFLQVER